MTKLLLVLVSAIMVCSALSPAPRSDYIFQKLSIINSVFNDTLRSERYLDQVTSVFEFFRAYPQLYWLDYGQDPRLSHYGTANTRTWLMGDAHMDNFGTVSLPDTL